MVQVKAATASITALWNDADFPQKEIFERHFSR
jgi:hypothetical protein